MSNRQIMVRHTKNVVCLTSNYFTERRIPKDDCAKY